MTLLAPTLKLRPGSPEFDVHMLEQDDTVLKWGVRLPDPSAELLVSAEHHGWEVLENWCLKNNRPRPDRRDADNQYRAEKNALGQVGAVLLATHYGTTARWDSEGRPDPGWDILLPTRYPIRLDVKTRQAFLTLRDHEMRSKSDYFALIEHRLKEGPYIFCGVIRPDAFAEQKFGPVWLDGKPYWAVTAAALIPPAHFHPYAT